MTDAPTTATPPPHEIDAGIWRADVPIAPGIAVAVHLVRGPHGAVLIDTAVADAGERVAALLEAARVRPRDVRVIANTHAHHDHVGGNRQAQERTGALVAAPPGAVPWIEDHERHLREFVDHHPDLLTVDPRERDAIAATLDGEVPVALTLREGLRLRLGDGVALRTIALPGHVADEVGFVEERSGALLVADAVPNVDWPLFHGHVEPHVLRATLARLRGLAHAARGPISLGHRPVTDGAGLLAAIDDCEAFVTAVDARLRERLRAAAGEPVALGALWEEACDAFAREREFRGLALVEAHLRELCARGIARRAAPDAYAWAPARSATEHDDLGFTT